MQASLEASAAASELRHCGRVLLAPLEEQLPLDLHVCHRMRLLSEVVASWWVRLGPRSSRIPAGLSPAWGFALCLSQGGVRAASTSPSLVQAACVGWLWGGQLCRGTGLWLGFPADAMSHPRPVFAPQAALSSSWVPGPGASLSSRAAMVPRHSRTHTGCHHLHARDGEQSVVWLSITATLAGNSIRKHFSGACPSHCLPPEHLSPGSWETGCLA